MEGGEKRYIRKEYTEISQLNQVAQLNEKLQSDQSALNATQDSKEVQNNDPKI